MSHTKIRDPNSREAKLISAWKKCCALDNQDAPIPQYYINGFIDGYAVLEHRNSELVEALERSHEHMQLYMNGFYQQGQNVFDANVKALAAQKEAKI